MYSNWVGEGNRNNMNVRSYSVSVNRSPVWFCGGTDEASSACSQWSIICQLSKIYKTHFLLVLTPNPFAHQLESTNKKVTLAWLKEAAYPSCWCLPRNSQGLFSHQTPVLSVGNLRTNMIWHWSHLRVTFVSRGLVTVVGGRSILFLVRFWRRGLGSVHHLLGEGHGPRKTEARQAEMTQDEIMEFH